MSILLQEQLDILNALDAKNWQEKLLLASESLPGDAIFSTSFSIEDQVITHAIAEQKLDIKIFTLDTGRLFVQTYKTWQETIKRYNIEIIPYHPDAGQLTEFIQKNGPNAFYDSKDLRLECCNIRKIILLNQALQGYKLWISGIRKTHSSLRNDKADFEIDNQREIIKYYPILDLEDEELWEFIKENNIPYNKLYDQGFTSIGCAPCSRIPTDKNDPRSGRWWWENDDAKECGLHMVNGKLTRKPTSG